MRSQYIIVKFRIPVCPNKPDKNNNIYTAECLRQAFNNAVLPMPLVQYNDMDEHAIGCIDEISYAENAEYVDMSGKLFYGGTEEVVLSQDENKSITSMELVAVGITQ